MQELHAFKTFKKIIYPFVSFGGIMDLKKNYTGFIFAALRRLLHASDDR